MKKRYLCERTFIYKLFQIHTHTLCEHCECAIFLFLSCYLAAVVWLYGKILFYLAVVSCVVFLPRYYYFVWEIWRFFFVCCWMMSDSNVIWIGDNRDKTRTAVWIFRHTEKKIREKKINLVNVMMPCSLMGKTHFNVCGECDEWWWWWWWWW